MCRKQGRRLLLVIDGLDEYSAQDQRQTPLDTWLPNSKTLPAGVALLVSSRANIPIPLDPTHPLRNHITPIAPSESARETQRLAQGELDHARTGGPHARYWIGACLAACGGPISVADLALWLSRRGGRPVLTGELRMWIEQWYHRSITIDHTQIDRTRDHVSYSHKTLLRQAVQVAFANDLPALHQELHAWADEHAAAGWPAHTPEYLLTGYPLLLTALGDTDRLIALALDTRRQTALAAATGADAAALDEIRTAMQMLDESQTLDPVRMSLLAIRRHQTSAHALAIPVTLPAVFAAVGQPDRALALARSMGKPVLQAQPWPGLPTPSLPPTPNGRLISPAGHSPLPIADLVQAEALPEITHAIAVTDPDQATHIADQALVLARSMADPMLQVEALTQIARAIATTDPDRALALANSITDPMQKAWALNATEQVIDNPGLARLRADRDGPRGIKEERHNAELLSALVARDPDWETQLTDRANDDRDGPRGMKEEWQDAELVRALADADPERACTFADRITDRALQAWALARIAYAFADTNPERAAYIAQLAARTADRITNPAQQVQALAEIAHAFASIDPDRATRIVQRAWVLDTWFLPPAWTTYGELRANLDELAALLAVREL